MINKVKPEHRMVKGMVYDVQIDDNFIRVDQHCDQYYFLIHPVPQTEVCHVEVCGLSESTRVKIGQDLIIPLNKEAMFYKRAAVLKLGERLSAEFDLKYRGKAYRAQVYERGILYAEVGNWGNTQVIEREN